MTTSDHPPTQQAPATIQEATAEMLADLELNVHTRQTYANGIRAFIRFLHAQRGDDAAADALAPCPIAWLDEECLVTFNRWLRQAYPDPRHRPGEEATTPTRTTRTYLTAARRLVNWLDLRDLLPAGVAYERLTRRLRESRGRRREGYRQRPTDPDTLRVVEHYLRQPLPAKGQQRLVLLRNRALLALLYDTAMRIGEALALTREDVLDGRATKVRLRHTKSGRPRTVFLSEDTRELLYAYVKERPDGLFAPLFVSHGRNGGRPLSRRHAWQIVKDAARAEGLYDTTSPHSLRHRRAQDLLDEGMALEWVAALLGHTHTDTTRIVYAYETDEERLQDMVATYGKPVRRGRK